MTINTPAGSADDKEARRPRPRHAPPSYPPPPAYPPPAPPQQYGPSAGYGPPPPPPLTYGQPVAPAAGLTAAKPAAYWPLSIIALIFPIAGVIGIYFSSQVTSRWTAGDINGAKKASTTALIVDIVGIVIGLCLMMSLFSSDGYYYY